MKNLLPILILLFSVNVFSQNTSDTTKKEESKIQEPEDDNLPGRRVYINLGGDFQTTAMEESKNTSVTNGFIGLKVVNKIRERDTTVLDYKKKLRKEWECYLAVTLASNSDTVKSDYGSSILIPNKGVTSAYFHFKWFEPKFLSKIPFLGVLLKHTDLFFYVSYSNAIWLKEDTASFLGLSQTKTTNVATGLYISYDLARNFLPKNKEYTDIECSIGVGLTHRAIVGDLSFELYDGVRRKLLGTDRTAFIGGEMRGTIGYKNLIVNASYIRMWGGDRIDGLARGQFLNSFIFGADIGL